MRGAAGSGLHGADPGLALGAEAVRDRLLRHRRHQQQARREAAAPGRLAQVLQHVAGGEVGADEGGAVGRGVEATGPQVSVPTRLAAGVTRQWSGAMPKKV